MQCLILRHRCRSPTGSRELLQHSLYLDWTTRIEYLLSLVCGTIGKLPIGEIEPADVLTAIRRIEGKGKLESARRSLQLAGSRSASRPLMVRSARTPDICLLSTRNLGIYLTLVRDGTTKGCPSLADVI
jgi:hypothetical protein